MLLGLYQQRVAMATGVVAAPPAAALAQVRAAGRGGAPAAAAVPAQVRAAGRGGAPAAAAVPAQVRATEVGGAPVAVHAQVRAAAVLPPYHCQVCPHHHNLCHHLGRHFLFSLGGARLTVPELRSISCIDSGINM
ncbi:hypothetical protein HaLaN_28102 [Haematococcus lacustris]|uniref:Uncharacterized protein n=1 Tax=Haematococcus lacustris TaxID=44745 RepID=A0A6A0AA27_HAELA|nr:hypothetical protein HaLaN_28102 [Haematococcus lacustris]